MIALIRQGRLGPPTYRARERRVLCLADDHSAGRTRRVAHNGRALERAVHDARRTLVSSMGVTRPNRTRVRGRRQGRRCLRLSFRMDVASAACPGPYYGASLHTGGDDGSKPREPVSGSPVNGDMPDRGRPGAIVEPTSPSAVPHRPADALPAEDACPDRAAHLERHRDPVPVRGTGRCGRRTASTTTWLGLTGPQPVPRGSEDAGPICLPQRKGRHLTSTACCESGRHQVNSGHSCEEMRLHSETDVAFARSG